LAPPITDAAETGTRNLEAHSRPQTATYRPDIDGLRGIAVVAVVAFHANAKAFGGGFAGVDVFFVISGYLISGMILPQIEAGAFSFTEFYVRRINRIFPSLIAVLLAAFAIGWTVLVPSEFRQLGTHILGGSTFSSNFILWHEAGYFDSADKPLLHLWALAVEEQFYLLWPLLAWFAWKREWSMRWTVIALIAISFFSNAWGVEHSLGTAAFYSPVTRLWEIMAGALLVRVELTRAKNALSLFGVALLVAGIALINRDTLW